MILRRQDGNFDLVSAERERRMSAKKAATRDKKTRTDPDRRELVIITGLSGSGKGTVLKVLEDLGFYSVDNLPIELIAKVRRIDERFAEYPPRRAWSWTFAKAKR